MYNNEDFRTLLPVRLMQHCLIRSGLRLMLMIVGLLAPNAYLFASTNATEGIPVTLSPQEGEWIARHPELRAGIVTNWAPYSYIGADGKLTGIDIDVLNLISQRTGLTFEVIPHESFDSLVPNWGHLDIIPSVVQTPLREKVAEFTEDISAPPLVIVEREGEEVFGTVSVLRNKTLALPRRHIATQITTNRVPSARVVLTDTPDGAFRLVAQKKADATVVNLLVASQHLNSHPELKLAIGGVLIKTDAPLRIAVRRDPDLAAAVAILNKGLASISQDDMEEIFARHLLFGLESRTRVGLLQKRGKQVLITAAVAGLLLILWNFFIRKEIRARRKAEAGLREANESMQVFSHSLSHDLRSPLRGIAGFAHLLKKDHHQKLDREGQRYLETIITSGLQMDKMISDVLDYSRTTNSKWPMETVELDPLVHQLLDGFPPEQRQYVQIPSKLPAVQGNATLLTQCLTNLLSNAVRFVPSERTPQVVVRGTQKGSEVTVFVEDNGIGIEPEYQKRIFQIFERAAPGAYKGTGIGLAVVVKAVERMGGSVGVESQVGKGSQFWLRLPGASAQKSAPVSRRPFWRRFVPHRLEQKIGKL